MLGTDRKTDHRTESGSRTVLGRYLTTTNAFREKLPPVPAAVFKSERDQVFLPDAPTGIVACDISDRIHAPVPATTPFLLARYLRIRAGETLRIDPHATAVIYYAIQGTGEIVHHGQNLAWSTGDIFCVPGGDATLYAQSDSMLWGVGNEPEVAFHGLELPVSPDGSSQGLIHFSATETRRYLDQVCATPAPPDATGRAIIFTTDGFEKMASLTPSMTLALNTMDPGQAQKAHRHNSAAITLVIEGHACYSIVDGNRSDWRRYATMVTPAAASHSHHNDGDGIALFLIVQDGGLFYQARAIGFSYV